MMSAMALFLEIINKNVRIRTGGAIQYHNAQLNITKLAHTAEMSQNKMLIFVSKCMDWLTVDRQTFL